MSQRNRWANSFTRVMVIFPLILSIVMLIEGTFKMIVNLAAENSELAHYGLFEATGGFLLIIFVWIVIRSTSNQRRG